MKQIKLGSIVIVFILLTMLTCSIFGIAVDGNADEGAVDGEADITDNIDVGDEDDGIDKDDEAYTGDETDTDDETDSESDDESDSDSEADDDGMYEALEESQITVGRVVFSPETNISTLEFKGEASFKNQLLSLTSESKPVIKIHNTTHGSWSLSVKYSPFTVNTKTDNDIRFAIRDETGDVADSNNNFYRVFDPDTSQLVYKASGSDVDYSVPWDESNNAVLKVFLSSYRHDLNSKTINSKLTWTIEVTPTSGDDEHEWDAWTPWSVSGSYHERMRTCTICYEVERQFHAPTNLTAWRGDNITNNPDICIRHCQYDDGCRLIAEWHPANWGPYTHIGPSTHNRYCRVAGCGRSEGNTMHAFTEWVRDSNTHHRRQCTLCASPTVYRETHRNSSENSMTHTQVTGSSGTIMQVFGNPGTNHRVSVHRSNGTCNQGDCRQVFTNLTKFCVFTLTPDGNRVCVGYTWLRVFSNGVQFANLITNTGGCGKIRPDNVTLSPVVAN